MANLSNSKAIMARFLQINVFGTALTVSKQHLFWEQNIWQLFTFPLTKKERKGKVTSFCEGFESFVKSEKVDIFIKNLTP